MTILGNPVEVSLEGILFATDFSPSAETAKLYVQALAERYRSKVRLMHVVELAVAFKSTGRGSQHRHIPKDWRRFSHLGCRANWPRGEYA